MKVISLPVDGGTRSRRRGCQGSFPETLSGAAGGGGVGGTGCIRTSCRWVGAGARRVSMEAVAPLHFCDALKTTSRGRFLSSRFLCVDTDLTN